MLCSMKQRGFTIVELVITISIMLILLALTITNLTSSQVNARDLERSTKVATIGNHMETFYKSGNNSSTTLGRYPSTALLASGETSLKTFFPYIDMKTATAPGATSVASSFLAATNNIETVGGVSPQPTKSQFIYQPIQTSGALCTTESQECRRYNIYYLTEVGNAVVKVMSKHQ